MQKAFIPIICGFILAGCEQLGLENPAQVAAAKEAEGRAIGSACRHSGRALEDCFTLNSKASKAAIFTGWRDMDAYMRENSIEVVTPTLQRGSAAKTKPAQEAPAEKTEKPAEESPAKKEGAAHGAAPTALPTPAAGGKIV